ncbi:hypothetical protein [Pseudomonas aeruginosa]|uniref:hypothetical protein n=1 Tax=Pseudomonas aeruginosa TaxID=287 RepID=UPI001D09AABC|nr:hypothetical protein [Pseudomonas aeruginosa]MCC0297083.1 hypothetical protein [Pseudomonas aeruginosa]
MREGPEEGGARVGLWRERHRPLVGRWRAVRVERRAAAGTEYGMYAGANRGLIDLAEQPARCLQRLMRAA